MFNRSNATDVKPSFLTWLSLFTSASTLICCALPALLVALGLGATLVGLLRTIPQLIWFSEHKAVVFGVGAVLLILGGVGQYHARNLPCPIDPAQAEACASSRRWSWRIYAVSVVLYLIGAGFAFVAPLFISG